MGFSPTTVFIWWGACGRQSFLHGWFKFCSARRGFPLFLFLLCSLKQFKLGYPSSKSKSCWVLEEMHTCWRGYVPCFFSCFSVLLTSLPQVLMRLILRPHFIICRIIVHSIFLLEVAPNISSPSSVSGNDCVVGSWNVMVKKEFLRCCIVHLSRYT